MRREGWPVEGCAGRWRQDRRMHCGQIWRLRREREPGAQSSAAQARGRVPGPDLAAAEEPAPAPYMMATEEVAREPGLEPPMMATAELKQVPEMVRQSARSL